MVSLKKLRSDNMVRLYLFLVISAVFMAICSYTSPLYYFDYSPDNNAFFTVGKAMVHGIVPYKDVFEQKGPYVYFLHGIASLIAGHSLIGIFPFEVISLTVTVWFTYKIAGLYLNANQATLVAVFAPTLYLIHPYFNYGDTTESLLYPFTVYLIYVVIRNQHDYDLMSMVYHSLGRKYAETEAFKFAPLTWIAISASVGIVFLSKYTQLGSWIFFYLFVFALYVITRQWKEIWRMIKFSLIGFLGTTIPWLIYFILTGSLKDFLHIYFYENIVVYGGASNPILSNLIQAAGIYSQFLRDDPLIFVLGFAGMVYLMISNTIFGSGLGKTMFILMNVGNAMLAIYGYSSSQVYQYYELAFMPYLFIPVICLVVNILNYYQQDNLESQAEANDDKNNHQSPVLFIACVCFSFFIVLGLNNNVLSSKIFPNNSSVTTSRSVKRHEPAQLVFGKIIRETTGSDTTLLNYGSIDMGFYTASGVLPSQYYFQNYNISEKTYPRIIDSQIKAIKDRKVEWVVLDTPVGTAIQDWAGAPYNNHKISGGNLNTGTKKIAKMLLKRYKIVKRHNQSFESQLVSYWLLQKRKHILKYNPLETKREREKAARKKKLKNTTINNGVQTNKSTGNAQDNTQTNQTGTVGQTDNGNDDGTGDGTQ